MKIVASSVLRTNKPKATFAKGVKLSDYLKVVETRGEGETLVEFIGNQDFPKEFRTMQQYEVDAGRGSEPILYEDIYSTTNDPDLPEFIPIYRNGPTGVIFEEIFEGSEVKFVSIGTSQDSVQMHQWGVGLEYTKKMLMYNYQWQMGMLERQLGIAHNALLNNLHLYPIINYTYPAANKTSAQTGAGSIENNILRTLEAAVTDGEADVTNTRRGPYVLLIAPGNRFTVERALTTVPQEGYEKQGSVIGDISTVIVYGGWTGSRGKKSISYTGVTTNKAYLISTQYKELDFQSFIKQDLESTTGNPDVSRFILEKQVWDTHRAVFSNPERAVQEVTLPTSAS